MRCFFRQQDNSGYYFSGTMNSSFLSVFVYVSAGPLTGLEVCWVSWLASEHHGSSCLYLPITRITSECHSNFFFVLIKQRLEHRSSCMQGKHFKYCTISPAPRRVCSKAKPKKKKKQEALRKQVRIWKLQPTMWANMTSREAELRDLQQSLNGG